MIIKKFQAKTEAEALDAAKKELGNSLVVMNVRSVKKKGLFSFFYATLFEVTVAKEEESETNAEKNKIAQQVNAAIDFSANEDTMPKPQFSIFTPDIIARSEASMMQNIKKKDTNETEINQGSLPKDSSKEEKDALKQREEAVSRWEKLENLQILLEKKLQEDDYEKLEEEKPNETVQFLRLLYNTMLDNEVEEKYANQIIDEVDKGNLQSKKMDYILSNVYQKLILKFGNPTGIAPATRGAKIIFFVGPTGVGKTTTIAKIASKFSVDEKKKIALITADTYRIAAAEQLRTYANILEVPFRVIYSKEEMLGALQDYKDSDYILVDTAGHSHQNKEQKDVIKELLTSIPAETEREVFLVLSATTKYKDLLHIVSTYAEITEYKLIFTKLDETTAFGNLLNIRLHTNASLSYVTCGQNVPDDIENFNPQKIVKTLLVGNDR